jgi:hypothetical protein
MQETKFNPTKCKICDYQKTGFYPHTCEACSGDKELGNYYFIFYPEIPYEKLIKECCINVLEITKPINEYSLDLFSYEDRKKIRQNYGLLSGKE